MNEQQKIVDHILNGGSCYVIGPPGTGKTETLCRIGESINCDAAFLPWSKPAQVELADRVPGKRFGDNGIPLLHSNITIQTLDAYFLSQVEKEYAGDFERVWREFKASKDKKTFELVGVDEVQDLRESYFNLAAAIYTKQFFACGDPNQTIFSFDQGDKTAIGTKVFNRLRKMGCKKFELRNNYRSNEEIVRILNKLTSREMVSKGPKTFGRDVLITRNNMNLIRPIRELMSAGIPFTVYSSIQRDKILDRLDSPLNTQVTKVGSKKFTFEGGGNLLLTVGHSCKGLGFDRVFLFDWVPNPRLPVHETTEHNLVYVAVSRASKEFYLVDSNRWNTFAYQTLKDTKCNLLSGSELINKLSIEKVL